MIRALFILVLLVTSSGCMLVKPVDCARETPDRELTCDEILAEQDRVAGVPGEDINQASCPSTIGTFNGMPVAEQYTCSDVCPDAGGIIITFEDVDEDECEEMGQDPLYDPAWGVYRGCQPACGPE